MSDQPQPEQQQLQPPTQISYDSGYNQGFKDGLIYVAECLRRASGQVKQNSHYSRKLIELAQTLERITQQ